MCEYRTNVLALEDTLGCCSWCLPYRMYMFVGAFLAILCRPRTPTTIEAVTQSKGHSYEQLYVVCAKIP